MKKGKLLNIWEVFDLKLNSSEKIVYAYLVGCSDNEGVAFPSVGTMADKCSLSEATVRRAINSLAEKKLLHSEPCFKECRRGRFRRMANRYYLTPLQNETPTPSKEIPTPSQNVYPPPLKETEEINKKINLNNNSGSVSQYKELTDILNGLELQVYEDDNFINTIRLAVTDMYFKDSIIVSGSRIPRDMVISRLKLLDIDCIDHVCRCLKKYGPGVADRGSYLTSCLYNAPMDVSASSTVLRMSID